MKEEIKNKFIVHSRIQETPDVFTLKLQSDDGGVPSFISGQYINVYFPDSGTPEGKAYSISSSPGEVTFDLTIKVMGEFSHRLSLLKKGDVITGSLPYGYFYSESESDLVLIAAGIGITPFHSMVLDVFLKNKNCKINLLYSSRTTQDIVFKKDFDEIRSLHAGFKVHYFLTRESVVAEGMRNGRIDEKSLVDFVEDKEVEYMICGGISFTRDMWRLLKKLGVDEGKIYTEAFFSH